MAHTPSEPRELPVTSPACPGCGASNDPDQLPELAPIQRTPRSEPHASRFPWTCGACWTLFEGTAEEFEASARAREERKDSLARQAARIGQAKAEAPAA